MILINFKTKNFWILGVTYKDVCLKYYMLLGIPREVFQ